MTATVTTNSGPTVQNSLEKLTWFTGVVSLGAALFSTAQSGRAAIPVGAGRVAILEKRPGGSKAPGLFAIVAGKS